MRLKFKMAVAFIILFTGSFTAVKADVVDEVAALFKAAKAKELAAYFAPNVEMTVLEAEDVYTKTQAEEVMSAFFAKNPPASVKIVHRISSNPNYRIAVLSLTTAKGVFRVSVSFRNTSGRFLITELRIENNPG